MKGVLTILLSFVTFVLAVGQEESDCSKILKKAQIIYDAGEIERVEGMLAGCLEDGFNRAEKTEALKLIVQVQLFEDNLPQADHYMIELLKTNPDFKPKPGDHQEIKDLYARFRTEPLLIVDYMVGINFTEANVIKYHTVDNDAPYFKDYSTGVGIAAGINANYYLMDNIRATGGAFYKVSNFTISDLYGYDGTSTDTDDYQNVNAVVNSSQFGVQLGGIKEFGYRKLKPYFGFSVLGDMYLGSNHTLKRSYNNYEDAIAEVTGEQLSTNDIVNGVNLSILNETGLRYKIGLTGKLMFSIRTSLGLLNQTYIPNRYKNAELLYKYYFVPDDYLLHNLSVNIGYSQLIYKPKKLKTK